MNPINDQRAALSLTGYDRESVWILVMYQMDRPVGVLNSIWRHENRFHLSEPAATPLGEPALQQ